MIRQNVSCNNKLGHTESQVYLVNNVRIDEPLAEVVLHVQQGEEVAHSPVQELIRQLGAAHHHGM